MKKIIYTIILILTCASYAHAQEQGTTQMAFKNDLRESSGGLGNLTAMFMGGGWWTDANGDDAAVLRIKVEGMSVSEMKHLSVNPSSNLGLGQTKFLEKEQQWLIAVSAGSNMYLEMVHPTYGTSSRLSINEKLKPKTIYDVTLVNNKTSTIVVRSLPDGAEVCLDGDRKGITPIEIPEQRHGKHELRLLYKGKNITQEIYVEDTHTVFDQFDFREKSKIDITSDPDHATIYIDGKSIGQAPISQFEITHGAHTFKAVLNASQVDEQSVNITSGVTTVALTPVKKSNVHITARYGGEIVKPEVFVDNKDNYTGQESYDVVLPYGSHIIRASYLGSTKEKKLRVNKPQINQEFKLSAKNGITWPWEMQYNQRPMGFSMGYVQKQAVAKAGSERLKFDPAYIREGKSMSGIQMGLHFQPTFSWDGGVYTGLFYELYFTSFDEADDDIKNFTEHSLYVPAHLYYRIPFSQSFMIAIHGGLGMDIGIHASYSKEFLGGSGDDDGSSQSYSDYYGSDNGGPNRFNLSWELAGTITFKRFSLNAFMSRGITDHKGLSEWVTGADKIVVNKFGFSLSYLFGSED